MILLDTNVWSALRKPERNARAVRWIADQAGQAWLSTIVVAEIRLGIENPAAIAQRATLELWLADLELRHVDKTLTFDVPAAHQFGRLVAQRKMQRQETKLLDLQIAAQALSRDCPVATRNTDDFEWTGVKLIDPWQT